LPTPGAFRRIDDAFAVVRQHLDAAGAWSTEAEVLLTSSLVLLVVSEYETVIEALFGRRGDAPGDAELAAFVRSTISRRFRSPDLGKITSMLKQFDAAKDSQFRALFDDADHAAWDRVMRARHSIVHGEGNVRLTFRELASTLPATKKIVHALDHCLK